MGPELVPDSAEGVDGQGDLPLHQRFVRGRDPSVDRAAHQEQHEQGAACDARVHGVPPIRPNRTPTCAPARAWNPKP